MGGVDNNIVNVEDSPGPLACDVGIFIEHENASSLENQNIIELKTVIIEDIVISQIRNKFESVCFGFAVGVFLISKPFYTSKVLRLLNYVF